MASAERADRAPEQRVRYTPTSELETVSPGSGLAPTFLFEGALAVGEKDVEALVVPVVESAGLEVWEVEFARERGRRVLRVTVDREQGVDVDTIAEVSERLSRRLDLEGFAGDSSYSLEVSSPGLERRLRSPRHFERSVGQQVQVKVKTVGPVEDHRVIEGALVSADAEAAVIASAGGELRVPYADISSARTVFVWGAARSTG
jgi:ribosome maturation factor RimP